VSWETVGSVAPEPLLEPSNSDTTGHEQLNRQEAPDRPELEIAFENR
jgi:hypothetical protein